MTGRTVTHYRVGEKLGEGGSSVVYRAVDEALEREVVLKFFFDEGAAGLARLLHEARTLSSLNHPNICTIYEIGQHEGRHFLAMELLDGEILTHAIHGRPLPIERVVDFAAQIADALDAAHAALVVHRDLKPANVFVTRAGRIKLLDFGVSALLPRRSVAGTAARSLSSTAGTVPYMSPEQTRADELDHRTDLFSFGSVLYEMSTGQRPFVGRTAADVRAAIVNHSPPPAGTINRAIPSELDRIIGKALEKDPKLRYQTAADVRADLQRLQRDLAEAQRTTARAKTHSRSMYAPPVGIAALIGVPVLISITWLLTAVLGRRHDVVPSGDPPDRTVHGSDVALPNDAAGKKATSVLASRPNLPLRAPMQPMDTSVHADASTPTHSVSNPALPEARDVGRAATPEPIFVARRQIDLKLFDQALETLRPVAEGRDGQQAIEADFLMAAIHRTRGDLASAMGKYVEIANRFPNDPRAPEALLRLAESTMISKRPDKEREASRILTDLVRTYPTSATAPQALLIRGDIEARLGTYQRDERLGGSIPTAAVTYREVIDRFASTETAEAALARLARLYADAKRFDAAVDAFERLAERDPRDPYDAWFQAANLLDKRLKDKSRARSAYERVPPSSPHYAEAQNRLRR